MKERESRWKAKQRQRGKEGKGGGRKKGTPLPRVPPRKPTPVRAQPPRAAALCSAEEASEPVRARSAREAAAPPPAAASSSSSSRETDEGEEVTRARPWVCVGGGWGCCGGQGKLLSSRPRLLLSPAGGRPPPFKKQKKNPARPTGEAGVCVCALSGLPRFVRAVPPTRDDLRPGKQPSVGGPRRATEMQAQEEAEEAVQEESREFRMGSYPDSSDFPAVTGALQHSVQHMVGGNRQPPLHTDRATM
ncbi:hypothetical protein JRQ81_018474 [Phrynocephalus forsythii]|uniref:Uncharacterized protein n=1 Tax=Phrynocephalus forsythii TaxID=171643 RepID=A0A9Q1AZM3_9SAUR|nr:hypothetical protein JRQ81_018474 [Phrynocephalus forsythii]